MTQGGVRVKYLIKPDDQLEHLDCRRLCERGHPGNSVIVRRSDAPGGFVAGLDQKAGIVASPDNIDMASNGPWFNRFTEWAANRPMSRIPSTAGCRSPTSPPIVSTRIAATAISTCFRNPSGTSRPSSVTTISSAMNFAWPHPRAADWNINSARIILNLRAFDQTQQALNLAGLFPPHREGRLWIGFFRPQSWNESVAAFGQAAFKVTDQFRLRAGVRGRRSGEVQGCIPGGRAWL